MNSVASLSLRAQRRSPSRAMSTHHTLSLRAEPERSEAIPNRDMNSVASLSLRAQRQCRGGIANRDMSAHPSLSLRAERERSEAIPNRDMNPVPALRLLCFVPRNQRKDASSQ